MKKPYLDSWKRSHIIYGTSLGVFLRLHLEIKKIIREVEKSLRLHEIITWLNKKLCSKKYS